MHVDLHLLIHIAFGAFWPHAEKASSLLLFNVEDKPNKYKTLKGSTQVIKAVEEMYNRGLFKRVQYRKK